MFHNLENNRPFLTFLDQCGVNFDNGGDNGGGNISSVLVWPWMAAVYRASYTGVN